MHCKTPCCVVETRDEISAWDDDGEPELNNREYMCICRRVDIYIYIAILAKLFSIYYVAAPWHVFLKLPTFLFFESQMLQKKDIANPDKDHALH
jgi:hypothetical protein